MSSLPKISIITPSFNQGRFIEQTIQSVLSQNYPNLEYIVMDGGSTDNTVMILKKYEGKLKWFSKKDKGQSDAINKGLKMATGDIMAWINSDDYYLPGTLQKVADYFSFHRRAMWVTGDYEIVNKKGKQIQTFVRRYKNFLRSLPFRNTLYIANYINQPSTFWRKSLLQEVGYMKESYHFCMDYDLWLRFMKISSPAIIQSPLSAFRIHSTSKGKNQYIKQFEEEKLVLRKNNSHVVLNVLHGIHTSFINAVYRIIK